MRKKNDIMNAEEEYFNKVWLERHVYLKDNGGFKDTPKNIVDGALKAQEEVENKYGKWFPKSDFEYGMMCGKLSALRWVLGNEWDFLDT